LREVSEWALGVRSGLKIGYVPLDESLTRPGDRRRFCYYARRRGIPFEIARPELQYDVVIASLGADVTVWSKYSRGKLIFDFIDAYLEIPRTNPKALFRGMVKFAFGETRSLAIDYSAALEAMCRQSSAIVCSTEEQRDKVSGYCSSVHVVLDFHSSVAREQKRSYSIGDAVNLVWEGLPDTLHFLKVIQRPLAELRKRHNIALHVVTDLEYGRYLRGRFAKRQTLHQARALFPGAYLYAWNEQMAARIITGCDIAVIPVPLEDPFARSKPENKLLLFWRMAMPAITSSTPTYSRAMERAGLPLSCATEQDWSEMLTKLINDESFRRNAGERGFETAARDYDEKSSLELWDTILSSVLGNDWFSDNAHNTVTAGNQVK
jgi:glycosyltransferase involved in cell wall biosynthesis